MERFGIGLFWLRAVVFVLLCAIVLGYACYVLTPKYDYGIVSMLHLYRQENNTVDVLVIGSSLAYAGVNTNVLWAEYGIAAYDLCSAELPFWGSYFYLEEALKTQKPKVILLDAKAAIYQQDYSRRGRVIMNTFGILSPDTRFHAIAAAAKPGEAAGFVLMLPEIHSNYARLTWDDFVFPPKGKDSSWKGYIGMDAHEAHHRPSLVWNNTAKNLNQRQREYFVRILELANEKGIPLLVVGFPSPDYANDHMYYNALWRIADEYGVATINFNEPERRFGLAYSTDFADWQHLNVKGSITLSRELGRTLTESYNLPDRRGNAAYASYDRCLEIWRETWPDYEM